MARRDSRKKKTDRSERVGAQAGLKICLKKCVAHGRALSVLQRIYKLLHPAVDPADHIQKDLVVLAGGIG